MIRRCYSHIRLRPYIRVDGAVLAWAHVHTGELVLIHAYAAQARVRNWCETVRYVRSLSEPQSDDFDKVVSIDNYTRRPIQ